MMDTIRWGIIGCGDVTEKKSGPAFNKVPNSQLVAVMRRDAEKAKDYAKRHEVATWYADAKQLIADRSVNAIYIATPPASHEEYTVMALRAGKHVYVEKPMALDARGARNMADISNETGLKLAVAHYRREQPLFKKVKSLLESGVIGDIRLADIKLFQSPALHFVAKTEVNWRVDPLVSGGGLFHDLAPHQLDLMLYFFGPPVYASGIAINQGGQYNADDLVTGHIRFQNGVVFHGSWCFTVSPGDDRDSCKIYGSRGFISFSGFRNPEITISTPDRFEVIGFESLEHVQQPMIESVVRYFLGNGPNPCSGSDGVQTMELIDAFTRK